MSIYYTHDCTTLTIIIIIIIIIIITTTTTTTTLLPNGVHGIVFWWGSRTDILQEQEQRTNYNLQCQDGCEKKTKPETVSLSPNGSIAPTGGEQHRQIIGWVWRVADNLTRPTAQPAAVEWGNWWQFMAYNMGGMPHSPFELVHLARCRTPEPHSDTTQWYQSLRCSLFSDHRRVTAKNWKFTESKL